MFTDTDSTFVGLCLQGFLYGIFFFLCICTCTLANDFLGVGLYSGLFVIYLQYQLKESRTASIVFYALCFLYVLSTATQVSDLLNFVFQVSNNYILKNTTFISYAGAYAYSIASTSK